MKPIIVGIGELSTSNSPDQLVKTFALGSCIGVVALAPKQGAVGLLHLALPDSQINPELAKAQPGRFADTGIPELLKEMVKYGCRRNDLVIKLAGGANIMDLGNRFEIGKRNLIAVKKILWKYKLWAIAEDVGENFSRTVTVEVKTGKVLLSSPGKEDWQI